MTHLNLALNGTQIHVRDTGQGAPIVALHGLGMDHSVWDELRDLLPGFRFVAPDLRGHGKSAVPPGPYKMGGLIGDVEALLDALEIRDAVVIGLSLGGMIAQGLAVKRLDQVRGLVLMASAAKFGQPGLWLERAAAARKGGMAALASMILEKWAVTSSRAERRLLRTDPEGYAATAEAISGTDFYTPTSGLRLPAMALAGDHDKSTPPDLVRETIDLIPGSEFGLIRGAGHLLPETHAVQTAEHLGGFLHRIAHLGER